MNRQRFVLATWLVLCAAGLLARPVLAQATAYRNGEQVEAQGQDGRWYQGKVWKVIKGTPPQYEIKWDGMPDSAKATVPEDKVRKKGSGPVVEVECIKAVIAARAAFERTVAHGKQGKWTDPDWNAQLDQLTDQFEAALAGIKERWPEEPIADLEAIVPKLRANTEMRRKQAGAAAPASGEGGTAADGVALELAYRGAYEAAKSFPAQITPESIASCANYLEQLDRTALEARMAADKQKFPQLFKYYGAENAAKYGDMEYGGPKAPPIADQNLKRVNQFMLPAIYQAWARMRGQEQAMADAVKVAMDKVTTVDHAVGALRLAQAIKACQPDNPHIEARIGEATALLQKQTASIAHLIKGPFHTSHMRQLVGFSAKQALGKEQAGQQVSELTPGKPFYLVGYLSESVKSLGFKRRDSKLGYETTRLPDLKFRIAETGGEPWRLPLWSTLSGDALDQVGAVEIDLMPDPATTYPTHFAYLPALHFTEWLLQQKPGTWTLEMSATPSLGVDPTTQGAHGRFKLELTQANLAELKRYHDALWAKKLSTVVYPDEFGVTDRKGDIPNADHLAKFGKLLKLTCAETNKVMKPFPHQTEVDNFVGAGFGLFEKDGRYEVIPLGFSRKPSEAGLRFTVVRGLPDDYALAGPTEIKPTVLNLGYEIPQANLEKTGSW